MLLKLRGLQPLSCALLAATFLTPPRLAQAAPGDALGDEFKVNTSTLRHQREPVVAMDADGDFVVVWTDAGGKDGDESGIFGQRYNAAGMPQGFEFQVNAVTTGYQFAPAVAIDPDGDFVVVWTVRDTSAYYNDIFARRFDAAGVPQEAEFQVNSFTTWQHGLPAVAMNSDGDFVVAWENDADGPGGGILARRFDSAGVARGTEFWVNTTTTNAPGSPVVAMDADGDFVVAWTGRDGSYYGIFAQRFDTTGAAQGPELQVNTLTASIQRHPSVGMDADGDFVVAWETYIDGSPYGVWNVDARRYDAAGAARGPGFQVHGATAGSHGKPAIAMDADGDFVVAWQSYPLDGDSLGVVARRFDASGVAQGPDFQVNNHTTERQMMPAVALDADGEFVVAWESWGQDGSLTGVYAQRYQGTGPVADDFTVDGRADILWRRTDTGLTSLWEMDGFAREDAGSIGTVDTAWQVEGLADFNADTKTDVLWRHTVNGNVAIWLMDGETRLGAGVVGGAGPDWQIVGTGDFDGDDHADLLWRNMVSGAALIWKMDGLVRVSVAPLGRVSLDWQVEGVGDLDADATSDIVWRNTANGATVAWKMENLARDSWAVIGGAAAVWEVEGLADFDGDAKWDILWHRGDSGATAIWKMNGLVREAARVIGAPDVVWRVDGLGDTNGDRKSDIIWRHTADATAFVWQMNGFVREAARPIGAPPLVWEVQ